MFFISLIKGKIKAIKFKLGCALLKGQGYTLVKIVKLGGDEYIKCLNGSLRKMGR